MLAPDLVTLLVSADHTLPFVLAGAMFPFFGKAEKPAVSKHTVEAITIAVHQFLETRGVINFKVYTLVYEDKPVVLIQAEPQKKLRFSNILEMQIKQFIREKLGKDVPGVFWRFKTDYKEAPGPEQADYEFDEQPAYPQDTTIMLNVMDQPTETQPGETAAQPPSKQQDNHDELYDIRNTKSGFEVEEITLGEFDEFLKGGPKHTSKE